MGEREFKKKICLLGDIAVGKTSLISRFVIDKFDDRYIATVGTKVMKKNLTVTLVNRNFDMTLMIWDVLGQSDFTNVLLGAFKDADGAMIVCDLTRRSTLNNMDSWIKRLYSVTGPIPIVILANKSDLKGDYQFGKDEVGVFAHKYRTLYYITSAKTGENVNDAFMGISKEVLLVSLGVKKIEMPEFMQKDEMPIKQFITMDDIKTIIDLEDYIIALFCEVLGGQDFAMPIVRQQIRRINLNFQNPTLDKIKELARNLVIISKEFRDQRYANELERRFSMAIERYESIALSNLKRVQ